MINVTEHLTQEPSEGVVQCFFHGQEDLWQELWWDKSIGMYEYQVHGQDGIISQGYMGTNFIAGLAGRGWTFLGTL